MKKHRRLFSRVALAALLVCTSLSAHAQGTAGKEKLVPARWSHRMDRMGFRWDVNQYGSVNDGTNDAFDGGFYLTVNGRQFRATQSLMTADGKEYVLRMSYGGLNVTRRILVDVARAGIRFLEIVENTQTKPMRAALMVRTQLGSSSAQVFSSEGKPFAGRLGKKDCGILTVGQSSRPSVSAPSRAQSKTRSVPAWVSAM